MKLSILKVNRATEKLSIPSVPLIMASAMLVRYCSPCRMHSQLMSVGKKEGFIHDHDTIESAPVFFLDSPKPRLSTAAVFSSATVLLPTGSPEREGRNFWHQNSDLKIAISFLHFHSIRWPQGEATLVKYTFLRGLLDYMYALCLTLSTDKTSVGRSRGWAFSWQYLSEEVTISFISRQGPEVIQDVK